MKKLLASWMGISLLVAGYVSASQPNQHQCQCENCQCSQDKHCGCLAAADHKHSSSNQDLKQAKPQEKQAPQED